MEMTKLIRRATIATAAVAFVAILGASFVLAPLAIASSSGSENLSQIEIIRAQTHYKTAHIDVTSVPISFAPAKSSPDMQLIRQLDGQSGLQAADDL
jgi:hypothetical protein